MSEKHAQELRVHAAWAVLGATAFVATRLSISSLAAPNAVDYALPFVAACLTVILWLLRSTPFVNSLTVSLPALMIGSAAIAETPLRLSFYGATFSITVAVAISLCLSQGTLTSGRAAFLVLLIIAPARLAGLPTDYVLPATLVLAGSALLALVLSFERVSAMSIVLAVAVGLITPVSPARATLFPFVIVAALHFMRSPTILKMLPAILLMFVAGRWAVLIGGIMLSARYATRWVRRREGSPMMASWLSSVQSLASGLRAFLFFPESFLRAVRLPLDGAIAVLALLLASFIVRPQVAMLFGLTAICVAHVAAALPARSIAAAVMTTLMVALWPWSGLLPATFPLPVALGSVVLLAVICVVPFWLLSRRALAALSAALLFMGCLSWSTTQVPRNSQTIGLALAPGESDNIRPDRRGKKVSVILSGAHISSLSSDELLAVIDTVDVRGGAHRRMVRVGEAADWAALRSDQSFRSRNQLPFDPAGDVQELGAAAWLTGKGRVTIEFNEKISMLRVSAARSLPPNARLQVESIEVRD